MSSNLSTAIQRAGGTMTGALTGPTFNATTALQTGGVTRLDASGLMSNVSVPAGATTVNIDASRITSGTLPSSLFPAASLWGQGIVQLSDSVSTMSSSLAASANAVKTAYDLAAAAAPKVGATLTNPTLVGYTNSSAMSLTLFGTPAFYSGTNNVTFNGTVIPGGGVDTRVRLASAYGTNWPASYSANARLNIPVNGIYAVSFSFQNVNPGWEFSLGILKNTDTLTYGVDGHQTLAVASIPYTGSAGIKCMSASATASLTTADTLSFWMINQNSAFATYSNINNFVITAALLHRTP